MKKSNYLRGFDCESGGGADGGGDTVVTTCIFCVLTLLALLVMLLLEACSLSLSRVIPSVLCMHSDAEERDGALPPLYSEGNHFDEVMPARQKLICWHPSAYQ